MTSLDTNVVVRLLARDDPRQTSLAREAITKTFFVAYSVIIESEWVLRSVYKFDKSTILDFLTRIIDLPNSSVQNPELLQWALDRYRSGADLADMVHIIGSPANSIFYSFDAKMQRHAGPRSPVPVRQLK